MAECFRDIAYLPAKCFFRRKSRDISVGFSVVRKNFRLFSGGCRNGKQHRRPKRKFLRAQRPDILKIKLCRGGRNGVFHLGNIGGVRKRGFIEKTVQISLVRLIKDAEFDIALNRKFVSVNGLRPNKRDCLRPDNPHYGRVVIGQQNLRFRRRFALFRANRAVYRNEIFKITHNGTSFLTLFLLNIYAARLLCIHIYENIVHFCELVISNLETLIKL